jgi:hypothetical protein
LTSTGSREGARIRLQELLRVFPDLLDDARPQQRRANGGHARGMSDAQRKAVSERMRAYWANRRADKPKKKG